MNKLRRLLSILLALSIFLATSALHPAHGANEPLLLTINGDIYASAGMGATLDRRTTWTHNEAPLISSDNKTIIYKSMASLATEALAKFGSPGGGGELPANIWTLDVATNTAVRIADQPVNGSIFNPQVADNYIIRSTPTWSPDSSAIAWTEMLINGNKVASSRLITYTLATKTTSVIVPTLPQQGNYEGFITIQVKWGNPGLAVNILHIQGGATGIAESSEIYVYSTTGKQISKSNPIDNVSDFVWITDDSNLTSIIEEIATISYVANSNDQVVWHLVDPQTGTVAALKGIPEMYSLLMPGGLAIAPSSVTSTKNWNITYNGKTITQIPNVGSPASLLNSVAISPDGQEYAYISSVPDVLIGDVNSLVPFTLAKPATALVWGKTAWRLHFNTKG